MRVPIEIRHVRDVEPLPEVMRLALNLRLEDDSCIECGQKGGWHSRDCSMITPIVLAILERDLRDRSTR